MKTVSDIGTQVTHTYQVTNDGPWHVDELHVIVDWPYQLRPPQDVPGATQGKWLLYMSQSPEILPSGAGKCYINSRFVNSLGLSHRKRHYKKPTIDEESYSYPSISRQSVVSSSSTYKYSSSSSKSYTSSSSKSSSYGTFNSNNRIKRESNYEIDESLYQNVILNCNERYNVTQCHSITCKIYNLRANDSVVIKFKSHVWNSTLVEEFQSATAGVVIQTRAKIILPDDLKQSFHDDETLTNIFAIPFDTDVSGGISSVPTWLMLVSVLIGLIVITLITMLLWKLGFFQRSRYGRTPNQDVDDVMISAQMTSNHHHHHNGNGNGYKLNRDEYIS